MSTVIDQDGNVQTFLAHYWRHYVQGWEERDTPEEAQAFLNYGEDDGALSSCCVVWPDGTRRPFDYVNGTLGPPEPYDVKHCPPRALHGKDQEGR